MLRISLPKKPIMVLMSLIMLVSMISACAPAAAPQPAPVEPTAAPAVVAPTEAPAAPAAPEAKKFTIGISNPFISSEYRTQMIQELKDVNAEYMAAGITMSW